MDYFLHVLILIGIYATLSQTLNLIVGHTGLLSIAHAAFFGLGAYVAALVASTFTNSLPLSLLAAGIVATLIGVSSGVSAIRVRDDYFAVVTFAIQIIIIGILTNWVTVTGGPRGLAGIPSPRIGGWEITSPKEYAVLVYLLGGIIYVTLYRVISSPFGRVLRAIREDEVFARSTGKNVGLYKVTAFTMGSAMAAVLGGVYSFYIGYIHPSGFDVMESIFIISLLIIGGAGSTWGPVLGAGILVSLPELLRFMNIDGSIIPNIRQIIYGSLLVLFMMWRPQGIIGTFSLYNE